MKGCQYNLNQCSLDNQQFMCIAKPDNRGLIIGGFLKMGRKRDVLLVGLALILFLAAGSSCRDRSVQSNQERTAAPEKSTSDRITEADAFYRQRKDLSNVRRGIITLRQARIG